METKLKGQLPIHIIHMEQNVERLATFKLVNAHLSDRCSLFSAIDGKKIPRRELVLSNIISENNIYGPAALGIMLSHLHLWKLAEESGENITIMEDDIITHPQFFEIQQGVLRKLSDFDMIIWGCNYDWPIKVQPIEGFPPATFFSIRNYWKDDEPNVHFSFDYPKFIEAPIKSSAMRVKSCAGTCCYTISPEGGKKLLNLCLPIGNISSFNIGADKARNWLNTGIDVEINRHFDQLKAYLACPLIAFTLNRKN